jgi:hypothetical protein
MFGGADLEMQGHLSVSHPGQPGRYLLPDDRTGASGFYLATYVIQLLVSFNQSYVALQGLLLIAMLVLYFSEIASLPRCALQQPPLAVTQAL